MPASSQALYFLLSTDGPAGSRAQNRERDNPLLALRRRLAEIEAWITKRRARPIVTEDARRSWEAQAQVWRHRARTEYGANATLHLQVEGPKAGAWLGPGPLVSAKVTTEDVERSRVWEHCQLAWAHALMLKELCGEIGDWMPRPDLRSVSLPAEPEEDDS